MALMPNILLRNGWRLGHVLGALAMVIIAAVATRDAWADVWHVATRNRAFSHVYLVPFAAVALAWVRRGRLRFCEPGDGAVGLVLMAVGWLASATGYHNAIESFWHGGALLIVAGAAFTVLGKDLFLSFLPAHLTLLFLIPLPGVVRGLIDRPLQAAMTWATQMMTDLPVAAVSQGDGSTLMMALLLVSYAFAFSLPLRTYVRLAVVGLSPISAIMCGVIHAAPTAWLRGRSPAVADNVSWITAWIALAAAVLLMMGLLRLMRWALLPVTRFTLAHD